MKRRDFFRATGSGVLVLMVDADDSRAQRGGRAVPQDLSAWLPIGGDRHRYGVFRQSGGRAERPTPLTQAMAEELRAPIASIRMVMADTELTPYDGGTVGSQTTPQM
jgi:isoquinoline 1-oxidoreductase